MNYEIDYPKAIEIGKRWYSDGRLAKMKSNNVTVDTVFNAISVELKKYEGLIKDDDFFG